MFNSLHELMVDIRWRIPKIGRCLNISDGRYGLIHLAPPSFLKHMAVLSNYFLASFLDLFLDLVQVLQVDLVLVFEVVVWEFQNSVEWDDLIWWLLCCPAGVFAIEKWTIPGPPSSVYFFSNFLDHFVSSILQKLFFTYNQAWFSSSDRCGHALLATQWVETRASFLIITVPRYASSLHICFVVVNLFKGFFRKNN